MIRAKSLKTNSRKTSWLAAALTLLLATSSFAAPGGMSASLKNRAAAQPFEMVDVIVSYREMPDQAEAARLQGLGAETYRAYGRLRMRAMRLPGHALEH